jgi:enoyl-CoA hydratase
MADPLTYTRDGAVATIRMDDGKVNALSTTMLTALDDALDQAMGDGVAVLLTGRDGVFSAGFDLKVLGAGGAKARDMLQAGFELGERLLSFPAPVVVACTGHAIAMGSFLLLSADHRVGAAGPFRIGANEVAIGLVMPLFGVEICRQRLTPAYFHRAVINAEIFSPDDAVAAGFLDRAVPPAELQDVARGIAEGLAKLDRDTHTQTKLRARGHALAAIRAAIDDDDLLMLSPA